MAVRWRHGTLKTLVDFKIFLRFLVCLFKNSTRHSFQRHTPAYFRKFPGGDISLISHAKSRSRISDAFTSPSLPPLAPEVDQNLCTLIHATPRWDLHGPKAPLPPR